MALLFPTSSLDASKCNPASPAAKILATPMREEYPIFFKSRVDDPPVVPEFAPIAASTPCLPDIMFTVDDSTVLCE